MKSLSYIMYMDHSHICCSCLLYSRPGMMSLKGLFCSRVCIGNMCFVKVCCSWVLLRLCTFLLLHLKQTLLHTIYKIQHNCNIQHNFTKYKPHMSVYLKLHYVIPIDPFNIDYMYMSTHKSYNT